MKEKKVLILNPVLYSSYGSKVESKDNIDDTILITLCKGFKEIGWSPTLIADIHYKPTIDRKYPFEIIYLKDRIRRIFSPKIFPLPKGLIQYLRRYSAEYDFVVTSEVFSLYSLIAVITCRSKLIVWHEMAIHNRMMFGMASRIWYNFFGRIFYKNVRIIARSNRAREFIRHYAGNVSDLIIGHGVDTKKHRYSLEKQDYFISVSQLVERKHIEKIIEVFEEFYKSHSSYKLHIFGDGNQRQFLEDKVSEKNMKSIVIFHGNAAHMEIADIWSRAKGFLIYTERDNSILVIPESIASATPVITTDIPDNSHIIAEYKLGIVSREWGAAELEQLVRKMEFYVNNCINYRNKISSRFMAELFIREADKL